MKPSKSPLKNCCHRNEFFRRHQKLVEISKILDVTHDGTLNYLEFQQATNRNCWGIRGAGRWPWWLGSAKDVFFWQIEICFYLIFHRHQKHMWTWSWRPATLFSTCLENSATRSAGQQHLCVCATWVGLSFNRLIASWNWSKIDKDLITTTGNWRAKRPKRVVLLLQNVWRPSSSRDRAPLTSRTVWWRTYCSPCDFDVDRYDLENIRFHRLKCAGSDYSLVPLWTETLYQETSENLRNRSPHPVTALKDWRFGDLSHKM